MKNDCLEIALRELKAAGIHYIEKVQGGKHLQLRWQVNGHAKRAYTLPCTPSDIRSPRNVRSEIRGFLREDGALVTAPKPSMPKQVDRYTLVERRLAALEREFHQFITSANMVGNCDE